LASGNSRKRIFAETENIFSSILLARSEENKKTLVDSNWYMHLTPNMKINIFLLSKGPIALFVARIKKKKEKKERSISSRPRDEMVQREQEWNKPLAGRAPGGLLPVAFCTAPRRTGSNFKCKFHLSWYLPRITTHIRSPSWQNL
jgi:hypothetical protein